MPTRTHVSAPATPFDRGEEFGAAHSAAIGSTIERYRELFAHQNGGPLDLRAAGAEALEAIVGFAPEAEAEIRGIAGGAGLEVTEVAALNARTEILARLGGTVPAECTTVVALGEETGTPLTMQTWDWHDLFSESWLVWTIEHPDGHVVHTLTEYGILGKIGISSRGIGTHLNILRHLGDGGRIGVPVHIIARTMLDRARNPGDAVAIIGSARTSASSVFTIVGDSVQGSTAICAEVAAEGPRFVAPSESGLLLHTNHFLDPHLAERDDAPRWGPDSYLRLEVLRRRMHHGVPRDRETLRETFCDHSGGPSSICAHADPAGAFDGRWTTLATVSLDVASAELWVWPGRPCDESLGGWHVAGSPATDALTPTG
ncbi:MAG TPA: C45 family peptidase [Solirubrobacteraceae bacterium]|jgi:isopenicillin-N N-acyltransferase-like protein